jgi:hypothetical protein
VKICENQIIKKLTWEKKAVPPTGTNIHAKAHTPPTTQTTFSQRPAFPPFCEGNAIKATNTKYRISPT